MFSEMLAIAFPMLDSLGICHQATCDNKKMNMYYSPSIGCHTGTEIVIQELDLKAITRLFHSLASQFSTLYL